MYNYVAMYPEIYPVHRKLIVEDKFDIKVMSATGMTSGEIINKF